MSDGTESTMATELRDELDHMLEVLRKLARGALSVRVESRFDESHPVGALAAAFNDVAAALETTRAQRQGFERQLEERLEVIERQRSAIHELGTPVIEVWPKVLTLPVLGIVDSSRADRMTNELLDAVIRREAVLVVIDVTGLDVVDTRVADHFMRMARAVKLLGAECVLSGVRPNVASTLVSMGVEVGELRCHTTLRAALTSAISAAPAAAASRHSKPQKNGVR